ncbi:MAG TPA: hypothetical protein VGR35_20370 [Tepidisphaeraceae bacterium]|nr:hypothetical protein [Tepidisphaeraceae bacterium]
MELREAGGCIVLPAQLAEILAYNPVMTAEIDRRFGPGSVQRLREHAARTAATQPAA